MLLCQPRATAQSYELVSYGLSPGVGLSMQTHMCGASLHRLLLPLTDTTRIETLRVSSTLRHAAPGTESGRLRALKRSVEHTRAGKQLTTTSRHSTLLRHPVEKPSPTRDTARRLEGPQEQIDGCVDQLEMPSRCIQYLAQGDGARWWSPRAATQSGGGCCTVVVVEQRQRTVVVVALGR